MKIVLGIFIFGFVGIGNIQATTIIVPTDQLTIQAGIDAANNGDTVLVLPDVYTENIDFLGKSITVKSSLGPTATTIAAPDSGSVVTFSSGEDVSSVLEGFTITNGTGTLEIDPHGVSGTAFFGGGIFIKHSSPTIIGNMITMNYLSTCSNRGGGIAIKDSSNPIIVSNTISKNNIIGLCDWINYFGGGIWIDSTSNPTIGDSLNAANNIYRNYADFGMQLYRFGEGEIINAQFNYFGNCPPIDIDDVYPLDQFDVSNCLDSMLVIVEDNKTTMLYDFILYQNYPNPFNSITVISIQLPKSSYVNVSIYNLTGQLVEQLVNEYMESGFHRIQWNAESMSSGMYLYRIIAGEYSAIGKCVLLK